MSKIRSEHLERQALIYVRQSTLVQVRENLGSQARQYDLVRRALDLGWSQAQIVVIDQDQGRSGASAAGRDGFQQLVAEVGMGQAGAVFSLEASPAGTLLCGLVPAAGNLRPVPNPGS